MAEEIKCPVCGKAGIDNYHDKDLICPCCGSDLSIFRVIDEVPEKKSASLSLLKIISGVACVLVVAMVAVCINYNKVMKEDREQLTQVWDSVKAKDLKIVELKKELKQNRSTIASTLFHKYIVQAGDSFWKISVRYYGTGTRCNEIAEWNNLPVNSLITPGDTILIK